MNYANNQCLRYESQQKTYQRQFYRTVELSFDSSDESSSSQDSCELRKQKTLLINQTKETFERQLTEKEETLCDLFSTKEELVTIAFW